MLYVIITKIGLKRNVYGPLDFDDAIRYLKDTEDSSAEMFPLQEVK